MREKYTVYKGKDDKGRIVYIFAVFEADDTIHPLFTFNTIKELEAYILQYDLDDILFAIDLEKERGK